MTGVVPAGRGHARRRARGLLGVLLGVLVLAQAAAGAAPAAAGSRGEGGSYRYWSLWEGAENGSWKYATEGPATLRPEDGALLGFRFALSEDSGDGARPRGGPTFETACADTGKSEGRKRVALRLDFGTARDAPGGERPPEPRTACARVADDASAAEALAAVAEPLRYNSDSLLCAIDGYPRRGCGDSASGDGAQDGNAERKGQQEQADDGQAESGVLGPAAGIAAGVAVAAALAVAAVRQSRRRR